MPRRSAAAAAARRFVARAVRLHAWIAGVRAYSGIGCGIAGLPDMLGDGGGQCFAGLPAPASVGKQGSLDIPKRMLCSYGQGGRTGEKHGSGKAPVGGAWELQQSGKLRAQEFVRRGGVHDQESGPSLVLLCGYLPAHCRIGVYGVLGRAGPEGASASECDDVWPGLAEDVYEFWKQGVARC